MLAKELGFLELLYLLRLFVQALLEFGELRVRGFPRLVRPRQAGAVLRARSARPIRALGLPAHPALEFPVQRLLCSKLRP